MNSSLSGLTKLAYLYLSHNQLTEFLLDDIRGLKRLRTVDLSYNKINKFGTRNEGKVRCKWYITPGLYFRGGGTEPLPQAPILFIYCGLDSKNLEYPPHKKQVYKNRAPIPPQLLENIQKGR